MAPEAAPPPPPPQDGRVLTWLNAVKGLTISNVLVIAMLAVIALPAYTLWKALGDDRLLDRFLSTYEEIDSQNIGCALRHLQRRGGPEQWAVSSGFAYQGAERWTVSVWLTHSPSNEEIVSFCEALKLIGDRMLERGRVGGPDDQ